MVEGNIFEELEDSRQDWKVKHSMTEIMMVVMCGVSVGEMSIYGIRKFAQIKEKWLKEATGLEFPNGLPSYGGHSGASSRRASRPCSYGG